MSALIDVHMAGDVVWVMTESGEMMAYRVQNDGTLVKLTTEQAAATLDQ